MSYCPKGLLAKLADASPNLNLQRKKGMARMAAILSIIEYYIKQLTKYLRLIRQYRYRNEKTD